jgi:ribonuclease III
MTPLTIGLRNGTVQSIIRLAADLRNMNQELSTTQLEAEILEECQKAIGYRFRQPELLRSSLTHASGANTRLASNERLEFLGDAVLGLITVEQLYLRFPDYQEGDLTKIKSVVVSRRTCARFSRQLGLGDYLFLGKGMNYEANVPSSMLGDVYESVVGGIYLDGGIEAARTFVLRHLGPEIEQVAEGAHGGNFKSLLQQVAQREFNATPQYIVLDEKGPDHSKCFKIAAQIGRQTYAGAWGRNKKEAEQRAAMNALAQVNGDPVPFEHD